MFTKIGDILESGAELVESESAAAFQRLLSLGAAFGILAASALVIAASVIAALAGAALALEPLLGLTLTLLSVGAAGVVIAGGVFWFVWNQTNRALGARQESAKVSEAKRKLRETVAGNEDTGDEHPPDECGALAKKFADSALKNPEILIAGCAAVVGLVGPVRALRGAGKAAGAVAGAASLVKVARDLGLLAPDPSSHTGSQTDDATADEIPEQDSPTDASSNGRLFATAIRT